MRSEPQAGGGASGSELRLRVLSGAVLALAAIVAAWWGGLPLALFWLAAAVGVFLEWWRLVGPRPWWRAVGFLYAAAVVVPVIVLRADPVAGLAALLWLFAVVWGSDVMAYVCGRTIGGPKLAPALSPKKTWSGFLGGTVSAAILGTIVAAFAGAPSLAPVTIVSFLAAVATQAGDLFESGLKRRFGVKDAGHLIPGHGGLMDRLDGFIIAGVLALMVGVARGGVSNAGQGVLWW